jgi:LDH2 family malate/lactate/ureidoglycolate dehydrogenase
MVDILTALCSGGEFGETVRDSAVTSARVCHFFMALRIDLFRDPADFKTDVDAMLDALAALSPAEGAARVYYAGQKEQEAERASAENGVSLEAAVWEELQAIARELQV